MDNRQSWCQYFSEIAEVVSKRSTCDRKHCGAVIVLEKMILSTGYNGSIRGGQHCDEVGHLMEDGHCVRTIHAEANALIQAARNGVNVNGAKMYTNTFPCWGCFKLIANAGIVKVCYRDAYRVDPKVVTHAEQLGIILFEVPKEKL